MENYNIHYKKNNVEEIFECTGFSLKITLQRIKDSGGEIIKIVPRKNQKAKKGTNVDEIEKRKLYISIYNSGYSKYKRGKITKEELNKYLKIAKRIKQDSKTKMEFENSFKKYKNELDKK